MADKVKTTYDSMFINRGEVIFYTTHLEYTLDLVISYYYIRKDEQRRKDFIHSLLSKEYVGFSAKTDLAMFILKQVDTENFKKDKSRINKMLVAIKDYRNDVAHRYYSKTDSKGENIFLYKHTVSEHNRDTRKIDLSNNRVKKHVDDCQELNRYFTLLFSKITRLK